MGERWRERDRQRERERERRGRDREREIATFLRKYDSNDRRLNCTNLLFCVPVPSASSLKEDICP